MWISWKHSYTLMFLCANIYCLTNSQNLSIFTHYLFSPSSILADMALAHIVDWLGTFWSGCGRSTLQTVASITTGQSQATSLSPKITWRSTVCSCYDYVEHCHILYHRIFHYPSITSICLFIYVLAEVRSVSVYTCNLKLSLYCHPVTRSIGMSTF